MAEDNPAARMALEEVQRLVADLEAKARTWEPLSVAATAPSPRQRLTLADLAAIRASLQRSVAHLDRLLVEWDQQQR